MVAPRPWALFVLVSASGVCAVSIAARCTTRRHATTTAEELLQTTLAMDALGCDQCPFRPARTMAAQCFGHQSQARRSLTTRPIRTRQWLGSECQFPSTRRARARALPLRRFAAASSMLRMTTNSSHLCSESCARRTHRLIVTRTCINRAAAIVGRPSPRSTHLRAQAPSNK
ncbi:hypothetical protein EJ04DRAFT_276690 [Polyplosphaeria fusca]|uniref:Secreted protein n=1 Tax=Polyplosphaeria fusca TaxID=682080 RepID=A0A9P4QSV9_9PLEO|nr:hypothetical protein EJ04DRAFT_276690 [Polyplosphaeria fusca]